jgi:cohesin loading factor subunit SCC2
MSLEKLPVTRQSARQFKLVDGKPIQLVSALLMRLVQTSATWSDSDSLQPQKQRRRRRAEEGEDEDEEEDAEAEDPPSEDEVRQRRRIAPIDMDNAEAFTISKAAGELRKFSKPLYESAFKNATHVIKFMINRALSSTKSGDQPYRNLLDIFTEDFLNVLGSPEWPAAEMLLHILLSHMLAIMEDEKRPVPHKNLALDLMGLMGSGISDLQIRVRNASRSLESNDSQLSLRLLRLVDLYQDESLEESNLVHPDGPYRMVVEFLLHGAHGAQTESARGLLLANWAKAILNVVSSAKEEPGINPELLLQLRNTIPDHDWLDNE